MLDKDEILYLLSGELGVWTSEGTYAVKAGDLFKIPRGVEHGDLNGIDRLREQTP